MELCSLEIFKTRLKKVLRNLSLLTLLRIMDWLDKVQKCLHLQPCCDSVILTASETILLTQFSSWIDANIKGFTVVAKIDFNLSRA